MGGFMAGNASNGTHFANEITAIFIACGQDVTNVAISSAGFTFSKITPLATTLFL
jgi:hydroxymethylglutaryl-CoA reductase (NADPH)